MGPTSCSRFGINIGGGGKGKEEKIGERKSFLFSSLAVSCMHDYEWGPSCEKRGDAQA